MRTALLEYHFTDDKTEALSLPLLSCTQKRPKCFTCPTRLSVTWLSPALSAMSGQLSSLPIRAASHRASFGTSDTLSSHLRLSVDNPSMSLVLTCALLNLCVRPELHDVNTSTPCFFWLFLPWHPTQSAGFDRLPTWSRLTLPASCLAHNRCPINVDSLNEQTSG